MIDEILGKIFGEEVLGKLGDSKRSQLVFRIFFGLLGTALGSAGAVHFMLVSDFTSNTAMRISMVALFVFLACFACSASAWVGLGDGLASFLS